MEKKICEICGTELETSHKFCHQCGHPTDVRIQVLSKKGDGDMLMIEYQTPDGRVWKTMGIRSGGIFQTKRVK